MAEPEDRADSAPAQQCESQQEDDLRLIQLAESHLKLETFIENHKGKTDEENDALLDGLMAIEDLVRATPAGSIAGVAAKAGVYLLSYVRKVPTGADELLLESIFADIKRLALEGGR